ncbi:eCIS core domain-containing protein [Aquabacterium parvum]|uniref:eCIS core domain-containing protein n=1 Tax=Aquabacterium parvum TaxID=70584 RepID=UPI000718D83D|nr:DUF4157 domain-containing protein [Aquabacterium parvum]
MSAVLSPTLHRQETIASPGAAPVSFRGGLSEAGRVQCASLHVSSPHDTAEREASDVARRVVQMPSPSTASPQTSSPAGRVSLSRVASPRLLSRASAPSAGAALIQREGQGDAAVDGPTTARIQASRGGGQPLSVPLRRFMEPRFGADFSRVRIHTDGQAQRLSQRLNAKAFTTGRDIYFNAGQYAPDTAEGRELIAHELAHTIQQGESPRAAVQRSELSPAGPTPAEQLSPASGNVVHRLGLSDILDGLAELAANVPGYTLLTLIIGRNPINMRVVERNVVNILRAFIGLIPGGELMFQVLQRQGIVTRVADWVGVQTAALGLNFQTIRDAFTRFTDSLSWTDIFSPGDVWRRARATFTPLIDRVTGFIGNLITQAITWLKETFMTPLSDFCRQIPGYGLVTVLLGRDPFTGAAVPRTAMNVVRAFAEFIPGGTEKVDQLVQSGALERAYAWFQQETGSRNLTWSRVAGTFTAAWASLQLSDVLHPIETIQRIVGQFRPLMSDLVGFAGAALMKLLELIYEAAMGAGGRRILSILTRMRATFVTIIQNPVGFLRNLLGAVGRGVRQFMTRILTHLRDGVIAWLTGPVARAGIQMPERWDLQGIIWFVLQILGLSWQRVRQKLVTLIGEPAMAAMERGLQFIRDVRDRGLVATLRERVSEFFGNLRESALGAIKGFIQQRLVQAGIQQLLSLLSPVGAVIQAIIKTYTTIQFFIQRINQIMDLVESILDSVSAIASGAIGSAANFVERTMARTIPVILDFLARFIGLGDVGAQVQTTIRNLQGGVDRMLDRAVEWIRQQAVRLGGAIVSGARSVAGRIGAWWQGMRQGFQDERGAEHSVYMGDQPERPQLIVASNPEEAGRFLTRRESELNGTPGTSPEKAAKLQAIRDARAVIQLINNLVNTRRATAAAPADNRPHQQQLTGHMVTLRTHLRTVGFGSTPPVQPFTVTPAFSGSRGSTIRMEGYMHRASPRGEEAGVYTRAGGTLQGALPMLSGWGIRNRWVAYHLLNEGLGGRAVESNLIPAHADDNAHFSDNLEQHLRGIAGVSSGAGAPRPVWMTVTATPLDNRFFSAVRAQGGPMEAQRDRWAPVTRGPEVKTYSHTLTQPQRNTIAINQLRTLTPPQRAEILAHAAVDNTTINHVLQVTSGSISSLGVIVHLIESNPNWVAGDKTRRLNQVNRASWSFD